MKKYLLLLGFSSLLFSVGCSDDNSNKTAVADDFIRAADISFLPEIESEGTLFYNQSGQAEDALTTLKNAGCNTVRIRLWKNPVGGRSGMEEVKLLSEKARQAGMKIWITVHYSDTWADPGAQETPAEWENLNFAALKTAFVNYTSEILSEIQPDIIQIGNEINSGLLFPQGHLYDNQSQSLELLAAGAATVRSQSPDTKIMIHYAGINGAEFFFDRIAATDYDYIGLSYYPIYHGKNLTTLKNTINILGETHGKEVVIAETAYPFTLGYNDFTNNILGQQDQIINSIPASPIGQESFLKTIRRIVEESPYGAGFAYWGGEWIAYRGAEATNGSSWENQALWDFDNKALPVLNAFNFEQ